MKRKTIKMQLKQAISFQNKCNKFKMHTKDRRKCLLTK